MALEGKVQSQFPYARVLIALKGKPDKREPKIEASKKIPVSINFSMALKRKSVHLGVLMMIRNVE